MGNDGETEEKLDEISDEPRSVEEKLAKYIHPSVRFTYQWQAGHIVEWLEHNDVTAKYVDDRMIGDYAIIVPGYKLCIGGTIVVYGSNDVVVFD